jgi:hypothetical protein
MVKTRHKKNNNNKNLKKEEKPGRFDNLGPEDLQRYSNWYKKGGQASRIRAQQRLAQDIAETYSTNKNTEQTRKRVATVGNQTEYGGESRIEMKIPLNVHVMRTLTVSEELELRHHLSDLVNSGKYVISLTLPFAPAPEELPE